MARAKKRAARRKDALAAYTAKRRFDETPEPRGHVARRYGNLYTIQKHAARRLHYDLRLELDGVLKSWAVTRGPSLDPSQKRLAVRTEDHPVDYATFEGRIPEGNYGAGTVLLWDKGRWEPVDDPHDGLKNGKLAFRLYGERLKGRWALVRFKGQERSKRENWLLIKERDGHADRGADVTGDNATSVASGRAIKAIARDPEAVWEDSGEKKTGRRRSGARKAAPLPAFRKPALATLVDDLPPGKGWLYEMKFDGYRAIAAVGDGATIYSRSGLDWTDRYGGIAGALAGLGLDRALLDGEIIAVDGQGRSDFSLLQQALKEGGHGLSYFVFDLLAERGKSLRGQPLRKRKARLKALLKDAPREGPIYYVDDVDDGRTMLDTLCKAGWEGVIAKRADSTYRSGRGKSWLKIKCGREQEFVIVGWSPSDKDRAFASILLGHRKGKKLVYAGRAGSGFTQDDLAALGRRFKTLARKTPPLDGDVPAAVARDARWLKPELVAQIAFAEFTRDGAVRHGRFLGLREDKAARDVTAEEPKEAEAVAGKKSSSEAATVAGVRLTHPDKVLYPEQGITKRDLATYLDAAAARMLPYCADRLISLVRCPQGSGKSCFFQRHAGAGLPDALKRMDIPKKDGNGSEEYLYVTGTAGLVAAAQMGVLELHIWGSRIDDVERPERIVFDLDPDPSVGFDTVKAAADGMRQVLDALGLASFPLLTGGKGVHVVVPIQRRHEWPTVKAFARAFAERFAENEPERYVATASKAKRKGRIFIDYLRNDRSATAIAPYSPRARQGAPVAWPVTWDALKTVEASNAVSIEDARKRLGESDPWKDYAALRQGLTKAALEALKVPPT
jgi:bifunctional non-homologous end joining protein LigD